MINKNEMYNSSGYLHSKNRDVMVVELSNFFNKNEIKDLLFIFRKLFSLYKDDEVNGPIPEINALTILKSKPEYVKVISYYLPKMIKNFKYITQIRNKKRE